MRVALSSSFSFLDQPLPVRLSQFLPIPGCVCFDFAKSVLTCGWEDGGECWG